MKRNPFVSSFEKTCPKIRKIPTTYNTFFKLHALIMLTSTLFVKLLISTDFVEIIYFIENLRLYQEYRY